MRFLKHFLTLVMGGAAVILVGWVIYSYGGLLMACVQVYADLTEMIRLTRRPQHLQNCFDEASGSVGGLVVSYRLRFVDSENYVTEAVCASGYKGPFLLAEKKLPLGVKKEAGFGGFWLRDETWEEEEGAVVLRLYKSRMAVRLVEGKVRLKLVAKEGEVEAGWLQPMTECTGWGGVCCNSEEEVGVGKELVEGISDCSGRCFSKCLKRPMVVSFTSDPAPDPQKRLVEISRGTQMLFSYLVDDIDGEVSKVVIDYGDGQVDETNEAEGAFVHNYDCGSERCGYEVKVRAYDADKLASQETRVSKMRVVVR